MMVVSDSESIFRVSESPKVDVFGDVRRSRILCASDTLPLEPRLLLVPLVPKLLELLRVELVKLDRVPPTSCSSMLQEIEFEDVFFCKA